MAAGNSIQIESFAFELADIADIPVEALHALSIGVRWPHRPEDWAFLKAFGQGIVARDGIGRVMGTAMWFPMQDDFATIGMVITSPRLQTQGTGRWMMDHVLERTQGLRLGLSATAAAKRLYLSLGFNVEATVYQCQGEASFAATETPEGAIRSLGTADLAAMVALDKAAFGAGREPLMTMLLAHSTAIGLERNGKLQAFSLCRPFGRGHVIGPVVAANDSDAIAVTAPHVAAHQGQFLRLDTRQATGAFAAFVQQSGLTVFDTVTTMSLHAPWPVVGGETGRLLTYALASQAVG